MTEAHRLPALLQLLDDDSFTVRTAVLEALLTFGDGLEDALLQLDEPPDEARRRQVLALVEAFRRRGEAGPCFVEGQVVRHKRFRYRGVIVVADGSCVEAGIVTTPTGQPWYRLLVHNSDGVTYVAQSSLEVDDSGEGIRHPMVSQYFQGFQNGTYQRNAAPWAHD